MFKDFWIKQRKLEPTEPKYISLCKILNGSGEDKKVITDIFHTYMIPKVDYDLDETKELLSYLFTISKDIND